MLYVSFVFWVSWVSLLHKEGNVSIHRRELCNMMVDIDTLFRLIQILIFLSCKINHACLDIWDTNTQCISSKLSVLYTSSQLYYIYSTLPSPLYTNCCLYRSLKAYKLFQTSLSPPNLNPDRLQLPMVLSYSYLIFVVLIFWCLPSPHCFIVLFYIIVAMNSF